MKAKKVLKPTVVYRKTKNYRVTNPLTRDVKKDKGAKALPPGKRISKNGKTYYEYRANKSDLDRRKRIWGIFKMVQKRYPNKPTPLKTKIVKHGSGYQVYDGRTKVQPTTSLTRATQTARTMEKEHHKRMLYWAKHRRR